MTQTPAIRCLILACGNTLRGDDGIGPWLAEWARMRFHAETDVRVVAQQQWTPELAEDVAHAAAAIFVDSSVAAGVGMVDLTAVEPAPELPELATHHLHAAELLALARELYHSLPRAALMLTVGVGSTELSEAFSEPVQAALPEASYRLEKAVLRFLAE